MSDDSDEYDGGFDLDNGLLEPEDSLVDRGVADVLDEGYTPPDHPIAVFDWGTTAREAAGHEALGDRLARELPDVFAVDDQVGVARAGRLVEDPDADEVYPYLFASDVGLDGAAASAEEAAVHIVPE